ncbi:MAG: CaiB/BaiF CoA-transferase family protein [Pseudomonadota bacterium]|nr:CaiB/BaiF CoA-transferase family protein [Pseudomonadales bacterium]MEC7137669.1 CaiB/BaiF CoA-transferase family protein [Pseudomonadota bacterium]MEC7251918.1 CaiB/BaiF CoA-transferase family protein [Pseudomonadota bacterium]MEC7419233.1 CaiB/BaiF CoA-transferase family protein [Pseudomonadota bacterium]MEC7561738.1 CaiB/BaiF CoA-transferase family protein [Pseudomonadota bacterium]
MEQQYPLNGLKVLDFSRVLAGPFAGRMLSDLGADVVKVEPPDGDVTRLWGHVVAGLPGYYHQQNAGKRNVCIDLRNAQSKQLVLDLVAEADILIENYRPDVMPRLGLGFDELSKVNPRLIMLSISGFGHGGPESHRPAYAPIVHAEVGLMHRQAERNDLPFSDLPLSVADTNASLHGLVGLLSAVIMRQQTGAGQHIDIAMVDATLATDDQVHYALEDAEDTGPLRNDTWDTGPGPILISADFRYLWHLLTNQMGVNDPTSKDMPLPEKIRIRREIVGKYLANLASWEAVEEAMAQMNLAWGQVRAPVALHEQPTLAARGAITEVDDRAGGTRPITQSPYRFSAARSGVRGPAPHRGEHNIEVLQDWLGRSAAQVQALHGSGVLQFDEDFVQQ